MAKKPKFDMSALTSSASGVDLKSSIMESMNKLNNPNETAVSDDIYEPRSFKRITYKKLYSSELNDYPIELIEEKEYLLLKYGLLEPFNVNYDEDTDRYEVESGDRRFHALQNLFERFENTSEPSPEKELYMQNVHTLYVYGIYCMVEHGSRDRDAVKERTIIHNETTRPFDPIRTTRKIAELAEIYARQNELLPKEQRFNVNEKIAMSLKGRYTTRHIIRLKNFDSLIDELKNVVVQNNINIAEISKYHTLTTSEQLTLAQYINNCVEQGIPVVLPSIEELQKAISETVNDIPELPEEPVAAASSNAEISEPIPPDDIPSQDTEPAEEKSSGIEDIKAIAAQKIIASKNKKETKIKDNISVLHKKTGQLEKAVYSYIAESQEDSELDIEQIISDIDVILNNLTALKNTLRK